MEELEEIFHTAAISYYVSTCHHAVCVPCMGIFQALAVFGDTKQAMGEEKSGLVATGLTRLVAMVLHWGQNCITTQASNRFTPNYQASKCILKYTRRRDAVKALWCLA